MREQVKQQSAYIEATEKHNDSLIAQLKERDLKNRSYANYVLQLEGLNEDLRRQVRLLTDERDKAVKDAERYKQRLQKDELFLTELGVLSK